jgi:hypothetical protein
MLITITTFHLFTLAKQGRTGTRELLAGPASAPTAEMDKLMMKKIRGSGRACHGMEMLRKEASQREFSICHCLSFPKDRFNNWDPCLLPVSLCILA